MATVNFLYRSTKEKAPLTLRLLFRNNESDFVFGAITKYEIERDYWKNDHFKKRRDANIQNKQVEVNTDLQKIENFILDKFNQTKISKINKKWLVEQIELYYNPPKKNQKSELVTDVIQKIIDEAHLRDNGKGGIGLSQCRINAYNRLLELFDLFQGKNQYKVKELNKEAFEDFKKWLLDKKNYSHTYAFKKISDLKGVCKEAIANGIETSPEITTIRTRQPKTYDNDMDVIFLSPDEITKIEKATLLSESLINARKWLILACYTGLAWR